MANQYLKRTTIYVEGRDDLYAIADLLKLHALQMDVEPRDVGIHVAGDREKLLALVETAVKASTGSAVGFVIDADASASATWDSIRHHIEAGAGEKIKLPKKCPSSGAVADLPDLKSRVGVWVMPDNSKPGILEDFLQQLVGAKDKLLPIAKTSTGDAKRAGATFKPVAESKAVVHAWLAWQADPGCPFGTAIKAHYFDHQSASATRFVDWVRRVID